MDLKRRMSAVIALIGVVLLAMLIGGFLFRNVAAALLGLAGLAVAVGALWWVITERSGRRILGAVGVLAGLALIGLALALAVSSAEGLVWRMLLLVAIVVGITAAGRYALRSDLRAADLDRHRRPPSKPVLICNPKSGDGKVGKFGIVSAAEELGVEVITLGPDDDLEQLARDAVAGGADCLGMAGGDGSQALVASVAVEHDLPFVCVSAGTRNHFALDLGLDRDDPISTLQAFRDGIERRVDYATVDDRFFVNNVSLGVYATVVQQDSYRANKARTAASMLPDLLGPESRPFDLQFTAPDGREIDGAFVVLVSNNPYAGALTDTATRRRMDTGTLGVIAVSTATGAEAARLMTRSALGLRKSSPYWHEFTAATFELRSRSGEIYAGVDGEALQLRSPLRFRSHPKGLRMLVPAGNRAAAERRGAREVGVRAFWDIAAGRARNTPAT